MELLLFWTLTQGVIVPGDDAVVVGGSGVVVAVTIAWIATNALYELSGFFFGGVLVLGKCWYKCFV